MDLSFKNLLFNVSFTKMLPMKMKMSITQRKIPSGGTWYDAKKKLAALTEFFILVGKWFNIQYSLLNLSSNFWKTLVQLKFSILLWLFIRRENHSILNIAMVLMFTQRTHKDWKILRETLLLVWAEKNW